jgi:hypothetical protein
MQASQPRRWHAPERLPPQALRLLPLALILLPILASLAGCTNIYYIATQTVATPTISPAGGTFSAPQTVTLTDATPAASIFYTIDGTTPTPASLPYTAAFTLSQSTTVKAIATASGYTNSAIAAATFLIAIPQAATPTFTPPAGTYTTTQSVVISDTTPSASIGKNILDAPSRLLS